MQDPSPHLSLPTGLPRESLRQAVHDLRGQLNTSAILLDVAMAVANKTPDLAAPKISQAVQELHRLSRMLDHLAAASDTSAPELLPVDLGDAMTAAIARTTRQRVSVRTSPLASVIVSACPHRLPRLLDSLLARCSDALPDGGSIAIEGARRDGEAVIRFRLEGPKVVDLMPGRIFALTDGGRIEGDWFLPRALARGMNAGLEVTRESGGPVVELRFPLTSRSAQDS